MKNISTNKQLANQNRASYVYDAPCHGPPLLSATSPTGGKYTDALVVGLVSMRVGKVLEGTPTTTYTISWLELDDDTQLKGACALHGQMFRWMVQEKS